MRLIEYYKNNIMVEKKESESICSMYASYFNEDTQMMSIEDYAFKRGKKSKNVYSKSKIKTK